MTRHLTSVPDQPALEGMPPDPPPPPNAGDLVRAWCGAYSDARQHRAPHPAVVKRVAGVCRNLGKECETLDDWRTAWYAASAAGRAGAWDVLPFLIDAQPRNLRVVASTAKDLLAQSTPAPVIVESDGHVIIGQVER